MQTKLRAIQTICWIGVAADALWTVALSYPGLYEILTGRPMTDLSHRLVMGIGASLMAGWTLLLAWTAWAPVERRAVLLITAIPVLPGLLIVTATGIINGLNGSLWILGKCSLLTVAMVTAYYLACTLAKEATCENSY